MPLRPSYIPPRKRGLQKHSTKPPNQPEINEYMQTISEVIRQKRGILVGSKPKVVMKKDGTIVSYRPRKRKLGRGDLKLLASAAKAKGVSPEKLREIILSCESIEEVFEWLGGKDIP